MKICFLLASALLASQLLPPALARIAENESQIEKRYGKSTGRWDDIVGYVKHYEWNGFTVVVTFVDGVSQRESFQKVWPDHPDRDKGDEKRVRRQMASDKALLAQISGLGKNGVILADDSGYAFTTRAFEEKYDAARTAEFGK